MRGVARALAVVSVVASAGWATAWSLDPTSRQPVGTARTLAVTPDLTDADEVPGGWSWRTAVEVAGAAFLKAHFVDLNLRSGDTVVVRSGDGRVVEVLEGRGPRDLGTFWGLSVPGDRLQVELLVRRDYSSPPFRLDQVIVGDRSPLDDGSGGGGESICEPEDFDDAVCVQSDPAKWATVRASVGVMTVGGDPATALYCSGVTVSPESHVLTAQQCLLNQGECDAAELVYGYHRTGCNDGSPPSGDWQSFRCDSVVASSPYDGRCEPDPFHLDFTLVSVTGDPAATFGAATADPVALTSGEAVYIVQHPGGRPQEITHGSGEDVVVDGHTIRYYDTLDTDYGSSGAPLFRESDHAVVGIHHCSGCATPGVGNRGVRMADIHPLVEPFLCTSGLEVMGDGVEGLTEVVGNGNGVMEPGETWVFRPRVRNTACGLDALGVTGSVELAAGSSPGVTLLATEVSFGDLPAGQGTAAADPVWVLVGPGAGCGEQVAVDLVGLVAANGGPFPDTRPLLAESVGERVRTTLLSEGFAAGLGAWTVVHGGTGTGPASTWTTDNPGGRSLPLLAPFAIVDSDELGAGWIMDEQLVSPAVDCSAYSAVELELAHDFRYSTGGQAETGEVDVRSGATGGEWVNLARFGGSSASGTLRLDLSAAAAGRSDVQVRFHYFDAVDEWWWAVDDVRVLGDNGFVCEPFEPLFADGFDSGGTGMWSGALP